MKQSKKIVIVVVSVVLIIALMIGITLWRKNKDNSDEDVESSASIGEDDWEIEAEYTYNGTISENIFDEYDGVSDDLEN